MSETITVDGLVYDLSKTSEESAQAIRSLSRVIQKAQSDILDYNDKLLTVQTALKMFLRTLREDHLTKEMVVEPPEPEPDQQ
jgi:hypothetical protein